jgi:hypothetical protein
MTNILIVEVSFNVVHLMFKFDNVSKNSTVLTIQDTERKTIKNVIVVVNYVFIYCHISCDPAMFPLTFKHPC